jgi:hypothetical protein
MAPAAAAASPCPCCRFGSAFCNDDQLGWLAVLEAQQRQRRRQLAQLGRWQRCTTHQRDLQLGEVEVACLVRLCEQHFHLDLGLRGGWLLQRPARIGRLQVHAARLQERGQAWAGWAAASSASLALPGSGRHSLWQPAAASVAAHQSASQAGHGQPQATRAAWGQGGGVAEVGGRVAHLHARHHLGHIRPQQRARCFGKVVRQDGGAVKAGREHVQRHQPDCGLGKQGRAAALLLLLLLGLKGQSDCGGGQLDNHGQGLRLLLSLLRLLLLLLLLLHSLLRLQYHLGVRQRVDENLRFSDSVLNLQRAGQRSPILCTSRAPGHCRATSRLARPKCACVLATQRRLGLG